MHVLRVAKPSAHSSQVEKTVLDFDQAHDLLVTKNHNMFSLQMRSSRACMLRTPVRAACPACSNVRRTLGPCPRY